MDSMRDWNLTKNDPLELTICSDARLVPTNYTNDQVWQLVCGQGEPPALALQTTFGLRARSFRLFPRFSLNDHIIADPNDFHAPPVFCKLYPNYIQVKFSPYEAIEVTSEYWVPDFNSLACRMKITNSADIPANLGVEWVALLASQAGEGMAPMDMQATCILHGKTSELIPVVFTTGNRDSAISPFPALITREVIEPTKTLVITTSQSSHRKIEDSFKNTRKIVTRVWDADIAHLEMLNNGWIDIFTGNRDWDIALGLAQKVAYSLIFSPSPNLPGHSFVLTRQPDLGYSFRGDGSDYGFLWNGQTPLDAFYLSGFLLPGAGNITEELVRNFLFTQNEEGFIDLKPGLAGQRSHLLATPLLSTLAWKLFKSTGDAEFLRDSFEGLKKYFMLWFTNAHDRDGDGLPEWDHPLQSGFDEHPLFSSWFSWSQGVDITSAEAPALCAFLYRECQSLIKITRRINYPENHDQLEELALKLKEKAGTLWSSAQQSYLYQDRETHQSPGGETIAQHTGPGSLELKRKYTQPVRLLIHVYTPHERTVKPKIIIRGISASGQNRVEQINYDQFHWNMGTGNMTGDLIYQQIDHIDIANIHEDDLVTIHTIGYDFMDHTSLLPLWAGLPNPEQAENLIGNTITNPYRFWLPFGIPACSQTLPELDNQVYQAVHMQVNSMIGEGLLRYGFRDIAAELVSRLMNASLRSLKEENVFHRYYHAHTGEGFGERNTLGGLPPLDLFLDTLGVRIISAERVNLRGINPFPWPITVKYKGLSILRGKEKTNITFPSGQSTVIEDPAACSISLDQ
jgi:hypothetical protein